MLASVNFFMLILFILLLLGFEISQHERRTFLTWGRRDPVPSRCQFDSFLVEKDFLMQLRFPHKETFRFCIVVYFLPASVFFCTIIFLINVRFRPTAKFVWKRFVANSSCVYSTLSGNLKRPFFYYVLHKFEMNLTFLDRRFKILIKEKARGLLLKYPNKTERKYACAL